MSENFSSNTDCAVYALTEERWEDLKILFGKSGAYWGCWCMYWRLSNKEFNNMSTEQRKNALLDIIKSDEYTPGLLMYSENIPVGWIGFGPRDLMERLVRSRVIPKYDEQSVLSVVCFFIHKDYRGTGLTSELVNATQNYAEKNNIKIIEAYPVNTCGEEITPVSAHCGVLSVFKNNKFQEKMKTKSKAGGKERVLVRFNVVNV